MEQGSEIVWKIKRKEEKEMARKREEGDIRLDFRNLNFSEMSEKGLPDPKDQAHPLKLLELFGVLLCYCLIL